MAEQRLNKGWHEINGIKYFGSHLLPDMLHDAITQKDAFRQSSYCQICMRSEDRCVCQKEGFGDIKSGLNFIKPISVMIPVSSPGPWNTYIGPYEERWTS